MPPVRPLDEQTILITGSTDGLGLATAERLKRSGATVFVHGRSEQKLERALARLGADRGARVRGLLADLSSLEEVRRLARCVERDTDRLDVLVNNAGVAAMDGRRTSRDGFELTFAVNYLSHFLLTAELLPLLRTSAPARIVNVASIGQAPVNFEDPMAEEREYDGFLAYRESKLAQILFTFELVERLREGGAEGVTRERAAPRDADGHPDGSPELWAGDERGGGGGGGTCPPDRGPGAGRSQRPVLRSARGGGGAGTRRHTTRTHAGGSGR